MVKVYLSIHNNIRLYVKSFYQQIKLSKNHNFGNQFIRQLLRCLKNQFQIIKLINLIAMVLELNLLFKL